MNKNDRAKMEERLSKAVTWIFDGPTATAGIKRFVASEVDRAVRAERKSRRIESQTRAKAMTLRSEAALRMFEERAKGVGRKRK
jgi:hypothetical protein